MTASVAWAQKVERMASVWPKMSVWAGKMFWAIRTAQKLFWAIRRMAAYGLQCTAAFQYNFKAVHISYQFFVIRERHKYFLSVHISDQLLRTINLQG